MCIQVQLRGTGYAKFSHDYFPDQAAYAAYRAAIEGVKYIREVREVLAPLDKVPGILVRLRDAGFDVNADAQLVRVLQERTAQQWLDLKSAQERIARIDEELWKQKGQRLYPFQRTGALWLTLRYGALLADEMGLGKAGPISEPVLTPSGWSTMGALRVGDEVIGSNGSPTKVLGVYPQGVRDLYKMTLANGASTRSDGEHLWKVRFPSGRWVVMTMRELIDYREQGRGRVFGFGIPVLTPIVKSWEQIETHEIANIEPCGSEEAVCIKVAAEDSLYVTKDFILTHNTLQAIVSLPPNVPALIVAPAVAKGVWRGEFKSWRPQRQVTLLSGRDSFHWPRGDEILVTNYDILPQVHDATGALTGRACDGYFPPVPCKACATKVIAVGSEFRTVKEGHLEACNERKNFMPLVRCPGCHPMLKDAPAHMVLIADEAHYLKSLKADRTRRFRAISDAVRKKEGRVWLLTGTPLENKPPELWAVFQAAGIAEEAFGSFDAFVEMFKGQALPYGGYEWGLPDDEIQERLRRVTLRRMRVDVLPQLPVKVWSDYEVELDGACVRACEKFLKEQGKDVEYIIRKLQSDELDFKTMSVVRAAIATAKIPAMTKIVQDFEERGEPLVVFSAHRAPIDTLEKRPGWAVITGDVSPDKRKEIEEKFQSGELKGVGLTIRAGGVALTLVRANTALFVDRDWKPTANAQAEDRLVRIGQKRGVIIMTLYGNHPLDERVTEVLEKKTRLISASVDTAATTDDAPMAEAAKEFEDQLHRIQEEIACGRAIRRMAETPEQEASLEGLHVVTFASASDERVGIQLAEEALAIGLSKAQWELARKLVARGRVPDTPEEATSGPRSGSKRGASLGETVANRKVSEEPGDAPNAPRQWEREAVDSLLGPADTPEPEPPAAPTKGPTTWGRRRR